MSLWGQIHDRLFSPLHSSCTRSHFCLVNVKSKQHTVLGRDKRKPDFSKDKCVLKCGGKTKVRQEPKLSRCSTITIARTLFVAVQKICDEKIFLESVNLVCIPHTPLFKEKQSCLQASQGQLYHKHIYTEAFRDHKLFTLVCHRKHSVWQSDKCYLCTSLRNCAAMPAGSLREFLSN